MTSPHPFRPNATQRGSQQAQQAQGSRLTTQVSSQGGLQQLKRQQFQLLQQLVGRLLQKLQVFERLVEIMGQTRSIQESFLEDLEACLVGIVLGTCIVYLLTLRQH